MVAVVAVADWHVVAVTDWREVAVVVLTVAVAAILAEHR